MHIESDILVPRIRRAILVVMVTVSFSITGCRRGEPASENAEVEPSGIPQRIIALAPNAAEIICALGACDRLVGVSSFSTHPPELADVPKIGGLRDPDLETVLSLKPDLIVLRGVTGPLRDLCTDRGIPTYDDRVESLDDMYRSIGDLGAILDQSQEAVDLIASIQRELKEIAASVAGRDRPRVLFTLRSPDSLSSVLTAGPGTFVSQLIEIAGGDNVFGESDVLYPGISLEEIVARDPQVIIEAMTSDTIGDARRAELIGQWRELAPLSAVRDERIHFVTDNHYTIPSQRVTLTARAFQAMIHPELAGSG